SGGVDSTALTALLARAAGPVRSFSVDYEDEDVNFPNDNAWQPGRDAPFVEMAAAALKLRHTRVVLPVASLMNALGAAMEARGLPGMADIDSSLLLFGRQLSPAGRYALSGECGDEVFGGYPWFHRPDLIERDGFPWSGSLSLRESVLKPQVRLKLNLRGYVLDRCRDALSELPLLIGEPADEARLRALQGLCFRFFMPNLQERAARMLGASDVRALTPLADDRLAQYVYNVPWSMKSLGGREKGLFRQAMDGLMPDALLWRKKSPYPKTYHPDYARLAAEALAATIADDAAPILQLVDREALTRLLGGPVSPEPWFGQLMAGPQMMSYLVQVNLWMLKYRVEVAL
ncbi:MAG: asparagine synthase, partial [Clostridiales bacterium]|nr:asparagine synthase [Clostridiales bacterium]